MDYIVYIIKYIEIKSVRSDKVFVFNFLLDNFSKCFSH